MLGVCNIMSSLRNVISSSGAVHLEQVARSFMRMWSGVLARLNPKESRRVSTLGVGKHEHKTLEKLLVCLVMLSPSEHVMRCRCGHRDY